MVDTVSIVRKLLEQSPEVALLAEDRVYAGELPAQEPGMQPRKAVVVAYAGGEPQRGTSPIMRGRLTTWCYGETHHEAGRLDGAVFDVLEAVLRRVVDGALVHAIVPAGAPLVVRDVTMGWPAYTRSVAVIVDQREVEA